MFGPRGVSKFSAEDLGLSRFSPIPFGGGQINFPVLNQSLRDVHSYIENCLKKSTQYSKNGPKI